MRAVGIGVRSAAQGQCLLSPAPKRQAEHMPVQLGPFEVSEPASSIAWLNALDRFHLDARGARWFYPADSGKPS